MTPVKGTGRKPGIPGAEDIGQKRKAVRPMAECARSCTSPWSGQPPATGPYPETLPGTLGCIRLYRTRSCLEPFGHTSCPSHPATSDLLISRSPLDGAPVIRLIRRFRACEAGAGSVEYAFLIAMLALGLLVGLQLYRSAVGGLTNRTAVTISRQSTRGYTGGASSGGARPVPAPRPAPPAEPEPQADEEGEAESDSTATATGGAIRFGY